MMDCQILNQDRWQMLLDHRLTQKEGQDLLEHFNSDCEACHRFFGTMDESVERLMRIKLSEFEVTASDATASDPDADFRAVMRQVRQPEKPLRWWEAFQLLWWGRPAWSGAFAVIVVVTVGSSLYLSQVWHSPRTDKGPVAVIRSMHLEFAIGHRDAEGQLRLQSGKVGKEYESTERLFVRFNSEPGGNVYIAWHQGNGEVRRIFPEADDINQPHPAGKQDVRFNGSLDGFPLKGLPGRHIIVGVNSSQPLDFYTQVLPVISQSVDPSTGSIDRQMISKIGKDLAVDTVFFDVR